MNKKVILSAILSIVLCLSIVVGGTFALFTSEYKTNIAVNSGKVNVIATLEKADGEWVYSPSAIGYTNAEIPASATNVADQATGKFVNGGFATLNEEELTLTNMTPGDKVMLNIRIHNDSTVKVKYSTRLWVSENTGLFEGLDVQVNDEAFTFTQQTAWKDMEVGCEDIIIPITVTLPEGAGNDFQSKTAKLSFTVSAVQANADTTGVDYLAPDTVYLYSANDLFMFAKDVNENGNDYAGKTVVLVNDISLGNKEWKPVGQTGYNPFLGNFNGNDKTVSDFYIDTTDGFYPEGADVATGFFGWINETSQTISNLKLDKFSVTAYRRPAGIAGYITGTASIINCHVSNATITAVVEPLSDGTFDNGDKAGGIVGYTNSGNTVTGCTVTGKTTISGYRDIGGIVGYNYGTVTNCKVEGATIIAGGNYNYKKYTTEAAFDANALVGEGTAADATCSATGVNITVNIGAIDSAHLAELVTAANSGDTIYLGAGTYDFSTLGALSDKKLNFQGVDDTVIDASKVYNSFYGDELEFNNVKIIFSDNPHMGFTHTNKIVYNNCTFSGTQTLYAPSVEFNNCTFEGNDGKDIYYVWTYGIANATFNDCVFNTNGKAILCYFDSGDTTSKITLNRCEFYSDGTVADNKAAVEVGTDGYDQTFNIYFTDCTQEGFYANKSDNALWGNKNSMSTDKLNVFIDETEVY